MLVLCGVCCHPQALQELQGSLLPRVLGVAQFMLGYAFIALSYIDSTPLSKLPDPWPRGTKPAAQRALSQLHTHGVAHGHVRLRVSDRRCGM